MSFGRAISPGDVEGWVKTFLRAWIQEYLAAYERQHAKPARFYDTPFNIETSSEFTHWRGENLPHIVIVSPGLMEPPEREADSVKACWLMTVTAIVTGPDRGAVRDTQMAYATVIPWMFEQNRGMNRSEVLGVSWLDTQFTDIPNEDTGSYGSASVVFQVDVEDMIDTRGMPPEPDPRDDPYVPDENDPVVQTTGKIITPVERIT